MNNTNPLLTADRDCEVVRLASLGYRAAEIGKELFLSRRTVEAILSRLQFKYECNNTTHLVATFIRNKIIE